jgi:hypothetical protein
MNILDRNSNNINITLMLPFQRTSAFVQHLAVNKQSSYLCLGLKYFVLSATIIFARNAESPGTKVRAVTQHLIESMQDGRNKPKLIGVLNVKLE